MLSLLFQFDDPDHDDLEGVRATLLDRLYRLRVSYHEMLIGILDAGTSSSAMNDQLDFGDWWLVSMGIESVDQIITSGTSSAWELQALHIQLATGVRFLEQQLALLVDNHKAVFARDVQNWLDIKE